MARIRTIKPDFWTDEKLAECSPSARLLFIGTWNFADDRGNLPRSSKKLKMQIFPSDSFDCEVLIQELLKQNLLQEYEVENEKYLHIKGFNKHQKIDNPSKFGFPIPLSHIESSPSTSGGLPLVREGKGIVREGKSKITQSGGFYERTKPTGADEGNRIAAKYLAEQALAAE